jgi:2'-5' RNA ligase
MSVRLFVAVSFPAPVKARLAALCGGLNEARWVREENFHLTVRFIGSVDEAMADDIVAALGSIRAPAFTIALDGIEHFGNARHLRMLWVRVAPNRALDHLADKVESALVRAGLPPEPRKFTPHVTLARFSHPPSRERLGNWLAAHSLFRYGPIAVDGFTLLSSRLAAGGSEYQPEAVFPLEGGWQAHGLAD